MVFPVSTRFGAEEFVSPSGRAAIYYAPEAASRLWRLGCEWLGRDAETGEESTPAALDGFTRAEWSGIVRFPRHYGFHATLKPPFTPEASIEEVIATAREFATRRRRFPMPALRVSQLGGFLALTLAEPCDAMHALADDCVREFDALRRAPSPGELAERRKGVRSPRQLELIERWGYPYVFDEWKFHMTLTSNLEDDALRSRAAGILEQRFAACLAGPLEAASICVFTQPSREEPFRLLERIPFGV